MEVVATNFHYGYSTCTVIQLKVRSRGQYCCQALLTRIWSWVSTCLLQCSRWYKKWALNWPVVRSSDNSNITVIAYACWTNIYAQIKFIYVENRKWYGIPNFTKESLHTFGCKSCFVSCIRGVLGTSSMAPQSCRAILAWGLINSYMWIAHSNSEIISLPS